MRIDVDELGPVQRKVRVELPAEAVDNGFSRAYQDVGRRVRIKGFRAGKVPRTVLQGIYGDEIKGQVRSQLVEDSLGEVIKERGLQIVSRPEISANDLQEGQAFSFSAVFEVKPEIEAKNYVGVEVEKVKLSVTEDQVDEALKRLQESQARLEPVEDRDVVARGDFVTLDFNGTVAGEPFAGGKGENYSLEVGAGQALPQFEDGVVGLRIGAHTIVQVTFPPEYPNREIANKTVDFSVVVRDIKYKVLPILDDEFAKDHGEYGSLEELKGAVRTRLEQELKQIQDEELKEQILSRLIEAHPFAPPASMVERQTRSLMERNQNSLRRQAPSGSEPAPTTEGTRKSLESRATRQVQATLLVEKIALTEKIEVTEKEVQDRIDALVRAAGDRARTVREFYSRPDSRSDLRAQMVFERTLSFLLDQATVKESDPPISKVDDESEKS
ncbi:MAG: trigger factor [Candidatus Binatia bacterium]